VNQQEGAARMLTVEEDNSKARDYFWDATTSPPVSWIRLSMHFKIFIKNLPSELPWNVMPFTTCTRGA